MSENTVIINGMVYDQKTGKPLRYDRGSQHTQNREASSVHALNQRSATLNRKYVQRVMPAIKQKNTAYLSQPAMTAEKKLARTPKSAIDPSFSRQYANHPQPASKPVVRDIAPHPHPIEQKIQQSSTPVTSSVATAPSAVLRKQIETNESTKRQKRQKKSSSNYFSKMAGVFSASMAILVLGAYLTYLSMPTISTRVAASQAGINATYPAYHPSGYSLNGPVAYRDGNVTMKFAANAGPQSYTLSQTKSGWDSTAVLDNLVSPKSKDTYSTSSVNGLTIYTYGSNATWVNKGILYTISGDAPLSADQVERIATSL